MKKPLKLRFVTEPSALWHTLTDSLIQCDLVLFKFVFLCFWLFFLSPFLYLLLLFVVFVMAEWNGAHFVLRNDHTNTLIHTYTHTHANSEFKCLKCWSFPYYSIQHSLCVSPKKSLSNRLAQTTKEFSSQNLKHLLLFHILNFSQPLKLKIRN